MKELHHKDISNIKTESEMTILSVKYDLEDQFKTQKVGCCSFVSQIYFAYFLFTTIYNSEISFISKFMDIRSTGDA